MTAHVRTLQFLRSSRARADDPARRRRNVNVIYINIAVSPRGPLQSGPRQKRSTSDLIGRRFHFSRDRALSCRKSFWRIASMSEISEENARALLALATLIGAGALPFLFRLAFGRRRKRRGRSRAVSVALALGRPRRLVLLRAAGAERLLLLGEKSDVVVESHVAAAQVEPVPQAPSRARRAVYARPRLARGRGRGGDALRRLPPRPRRGRAPALRHPGLVSGRSRARRGGDGARRRGRHGARGLSRAPLRSSGGRQRHSACRIGASTAASRHRRRCCCR